MIWNQSKTHNINIVEITEFHFHDFVAKISLN